MTLPSMGSSVISMCERERIIHWKEEDMTAPRIMSAQNLYARVVNGKKMSSSAKVYAR